MPDPSTLADMDVAATRLAAAVANNERVALFGDYDVDGTTAVALMYLYLSKIVDKKYLDFSRTSKAKEVDLGEKLNNEI